MSKKPFYKKVWLFALLAVVAVILVIIASYLWYHQALKPVSVSETSAKQIVIQSGSTPDMIGEQLENENLIHSHTAFSIYTRLEGVRGSLKAGSYRLSPSESTQQIVRHLVDGQINEFSVMFYPGASLNVDTNPNDGTPSHREVLLKLGYSDAEIDKAFAAKYDHPLLADKPASASLEGYVYGVQFNVHGGSSVEDILERSFDEFYTDIEEMDLLPKLKARGWNLHQAVTLASVIQREVGKPADQKQVAQVFYSRLEVGMPLGADATFVYAAALDDASPSVNYPSPYNTRIHAGLPPGPIASPNITALEAVAEPADGDYLYFVSGDDGLNYFSRTLEEHERNTREHCQVNCSLF